MISIEVTDQDKEFAKKQIEKFQKIPQGQYRYENVHAWRGVVSELLCSRWLSNRFNVEQDAICLEDLGRYDNYDMMINGKKVEIKSATKFHFKYIMPKVSNVFDRPKDIYVGCRYHEMLEPNRVEIHGWMRHDDIIEYPIKQNKGAKYFEVPLFDLKQFKL